MTTNWRRSGALAAAGLAILLALTLAACGGSSGTGSSGATPAGGGAASTPAAVMKALNQLTTCLSGQGVKVPSPITRKGLRTTIRDLPSAKRSSVITACQTQVDALLAMRPGR